MILVYWHVDITWPDENWVTTEADSVELSWVESGALNWALLFMRQIPRFLSQNWNQCNFGLLLSKFGCHGNYLGSIKNSGSIFEFTNSVYPTIDLKNSIFFAQNWNLCHFGLFLSKFDCHDNSLGFPDILDSIFEFADHENLIIRVKKSSISCAELNSVQFWLIFAQIWLPWQLRWLRWNFR